MFKTLSCAAMFAFAASACAIPAAAQTLTQTPGSKITVSQCNPHQHHVGMPGHPWIDPYGIYHGAEPFPYTEGFLEVGYTNNASKPAKEVDFGLVSRGSLIAYAKDVGTFSPGVAIDHEFSVDPEIFPIGTALPYCAVLRVVYTDGTQWQNPTPPQQ
ncbi:MAG TPA: hypothetical protein VGZ02_08580 [Candidatus Baltobacteraceae bacterium]|nr:hypothetical protein [Candidatus Baltobacteraceae bacterium]